MLENWVDERVLDVLMCFEKAVSVSVYTVPGCGQLTPIRPDKLGAPELDYVPSYPTIPQILPLIGFLRLH